MNSENNSNNNMEYLDDSAGFEELQNAMEEIAKLDNTSKEKVIEPSGAKIIPTVTESDDEQPEEDTEVLVDEEEEKEEFAPKKEKEKDPYWKLKKDKFSILKTAKQVAQERDEIKQRYEELQQRYDEALSSGAYHYSERASAELEKAKQDKKRAINEGDADALVEADIVITNALQKMKEIENWNYNAQQRQARSQEYYSPPQYQQNPNPKVLDIDAQIDQEMANAWLEDHKYLQPDSKEYDPNLSKKVINYANYLDSDYRSNGADHLIFSEEYFDNVDNYIATIRKGITKKTETNKSIASLAPVGAVRNSTRSQTAADIKLNSTEKEWAKQFGVSEDYYKKVKFDDLKKGKK